VSAGLVAGPAEFYFEVAGVSPAICSPFVKENVLPLLSGSSLQPIEIATKLGAFLEPYHFDVTFFCSAPRYDIELLKPFLPARLRWRFAVPSFNDLASQELFEIAHEGAFASGLRRHHALDDARALSVSWAAQLQPRRT
jgi:hypothetical protein